MSLQQLFTSRKIYDATTFVAGKGKLFYNETTGQLRLGDGSTPGGLALNSSLVNGTWTVSLSTSGALTVPYPGNLVADTINVTNLNVSNLNLIGPTNYLWLSLYQYYSGSLQTSIFGSITGTAVGTTHPITGLTQLSTSGRGSGAIFQVTVYYNGSGTSYINLGIDYNGGNQQYGTGYAVGDTVTIAGASLGGTTPANNLTFTIGNAVKNNYPAGLEGGMIYDYSTKHFLVYNGSAWTQLDNPLTPSGTKASNAYGVAGQTSYDSDYFYTCIATNTWRRVALGSTY